MLGGHGGHGLQVRGGQLAIDRRTEVSELERDIRIGVRDGESCRAARDGAGTPAASSRLSTSSPSRPAATRMPAPLRSAHRFHELVDGLTRHETVGAEAPAVAHDETLQPAVIRCAQQRRAHHSRSSKPAGSCVVIALLARSTVDAICLEHRHERAFRPDREHVANRVRARRRRRCPARRGAHRSPSSRQVPDSRYAFAGKGGKSATCAWSVMPRSAPASIRVGHAFEQNAHVPGRGGRTRSTINMRLTPGRARDERQPGPKL